MLKHLLSLLLLAPITLIATAQDTDLIIANTIPLELRDHANAVIRLETLALDLTAPNKLITKHKRIVTVFNSEGNSNIDAYVYYDNGIKINDIQVLIYDAFGKEIKKIKKRDFKDVSAVDGGTLYSDSRVLYLNYTAISYPYTVEFTYETEAKNTSYIPSFSPLSDYFVSVEDYRYEVRYGDNIKLTTKEKNLDSFDIENQSTTGNLAFQVRNLKAFKPEDFGPKLSEISPEVLVAVVNFVYEGYSGNGENWKDLGKWMYDELLSGRTSVSDQTKNNILNLTQGIEDKTEKAKLVYEYVQKNTRYISVQEGIGGNQPIAAIDVDRLKYGDCKGLSNYTRALLRLVGIESYYTRVNASAKSKISVEKDFVSFQGQTNHIILNVPIEDKESIWLECTSQTIPFGFLGSFTDDRDVLLITPEGGKIVHTPKYITRDNSQRVEASYEIFEDGGIEAQMNTISKGLKYDELFRIESLNKKELDEYYKNRWNYINNLKLESIENKNDKETIQFKENIHFTASNYANLVKERMLVGLNVFSKNNFIPDRYRTRTMPLKINRGFVESDSVLIKLPKGFKIEAIPESIQIENKFGEYQMSVSIASDENLLYTRSFMLKDGEYPKEDYNTFREFYKDIARYDNSKISLLKVSQ
ncbi:DUF3857 domain-containing protein [Flavobacteriaceae bacterium LMO-SS05]